MAHHTKLLGDRLYLWKPRSASSIQLFQDSAEQQNVTGGHGSRTSTEQRNPGALARRASAVSRGASSRSALDTAIGQGLQNAGALDRQRRESVQQLGVVGLAGGFGELLQGEGAQGQAGLGRELLEPGGHLIGHVADVEGAHDGHLLADGEQARADG